MLILQLRTKNRQSQSEVKSGNKKTNGIGPKEQMFLCVILGTKEVVYLSETSPETLPCIHSNVRRISSVFTSYEHRPTLLHSLNCWV